MATLGHSHATARALRTEGLENGNRPLPMQLPDL